MSTTATIAPRHVNNIEASILHALIDRHLFHNGKWCYGHSRPKHHSYDYACEVCQAIDERSVAEVVFGSPHPRNIPCYTIEDIVRAMKCMDATTQSVFEVFIRAASKGRCLALTSRLVEVAALQALGIIDSQGFLKGDQDREEGAL